MEDTKEEDTNNNTEDTKSNLEDVHSNLLDEFKEDFALLIESGFVATKQLDEINSTRIFNAAQALNPDSAAPKIGLGNIALQKMDIKEATKIFEEAVELDEKNYLAQCFLGICFMLTKDKMKKGERLIRDIMEKTDDETVKNLGKVSLDWAATDLSKRSKSPFEM